MCGLVGAVSDRNIVPVMIEGLHRLEYRGYDSAGLAVLDADTQVQRLRRVGKVRELEDALAQQPLTGHIGISHTRWATHGEPAERNAHPHSSADLVAVVHNGIIENHEPLRNQLREAGYEFHSETDTEVIVHLVHQKLASGGTLFEALQEATRELHGAWAVGLLHRNEPDRLVVARRGSPLVIGIGEHGHYAASDVAALLSVTNRFIFLEEGDVAELTRDALRIVDADGSPVEREERISSLTADAVDKGGYAHFMLKEIFEQPQALQQTLAGRLASDHVLSATFGPNADAFFQDIRGVHIVACGTSYHSGLVARYWIETLARIPCVVEIASEYRYRQPVVLENRLFVTISQSGETADTLAALRLAKDLPYRGTLSICNVAESSLVRESDLALMTCAGPEIGVASTKAFTTQLTALLLLAAALRGRLTNESEAVVVEDLHTLIPAVEETLRLEPQIRELARRFADKHHALFLGRGPHYPVAMEGALKLKEISYIHAEAYAAGELKHGPLALVDADMPVVAVAPNNELLEKLKSNLEEVRARGGELIVFADRQAGMQSGPGVMVLDMPHAEELIAPIVYTVPLQLLAYHVALIKGTDVDQPRNLAKSVTVE